MRTQWLHREDRDALLFFFSGWGVDTRPFSHFAAKDYDVLFCDSYTTANNIDTNKLGLGHYKKKVVVGWSMGVLIGEQVLGNSSLSIEEGYAVNGTLCPVNIKYGIDPHWFCKTLETFEQNVLEKFYKRMCLKNDILTFFKERKPERTQESLQKELEVLYELGNGAYRKSLLFSKAIISCRDMIIPTKNQREFWEKQSVPVEMTDEPHYCFFGMKSWDQLLNTLRSTSKKTLIAVNERK